MNVIKTLTLLALLAISTVSIGQDVESRLVDRIGEDKIEKIYSFRYDYYHFLVYEIDAGYVLKSKAELSKDQRSAAKSVEGVVSTKDNTPFTQELINNEKFDFLTFSFERDMKNDLIYKLSNDQYMIIYSKQNIAKMYKATFGSEKRKAPAKK
jgi:hypothetical protein